MSTEPIKRGTIQFSGNEFCPEVEFDRIALRGRHTLLFVSVIADQMRVKQIRAILSAGLKCTIIAGGVRVNTPKGDHWNSFSPGRISADSDGYEVFTHKLGYNMTHAMFVTKSAGFLKIVTEESLWQELKGPRYTTPILREWMPYLEERLRADGRLEDAFGYNCECGILSATNSMLDEAVSEGLQQRMISIPDLAAAD